MKTLSLFKQKPKVVKYRPAPKTRLIGSLDLDRKGELEKFKKWLEFASKEKSDLPTEDEIKKLNKDIEKQPASGFSIASLLSALPFALPGLGALGLGALTAGALAFGNPQRYATRLIIKSLAKGGLKLGQKLLPKNQKVPKANTSLPPRPGTRGRPRVTTTGGGRAGRPDFRNPLRQRPGVTGTGGGIFGRPDIRNPLRQRPRVTSGFGGRPLTQRMANRIFNRLVRSKFGMRALSRFIRPAVRGIPFLGTAIGSLIDIFVFGDSSGKAIFKNAIGGVAAAIGVGLVTFLTGGIGLLGSAVVGTVSQQAGYWLGGWLYDRIFGTNNAKKGEERNNEDDASGGSEAITPEGDEVDTVDNIKDSSGRPIRLIGPAAAAFTRMARDAKEEGVDLGSGISSSYRSEADQIRVYRNKYGNDWEKYYVSNSPHMYGEAFDINWNSAAGKWIRANASRYGFQYNTYSGESTHFDWKGGGTTSRQSTRAESQSNSPSVPSIPFAEGMANPLEFLNLLGSVLTPPPPMQEVSAVKTDTNIARFTPEAEAANSESIVVVTQAAAPQLPQQTGGAQIVPFPVGGSGSGQSTTVVVSSLNSLEDLLLTKLDNA